MIKGKTIQQLAATLQANTEAKKDFVSDTREMNMEPSHNMLDINNVGTFEVNHIAHQQIANRLGIPKRYYDAMHQEAPGLLSTNVNHWFQNEPARRMVRTMNGTARAFLSDRYRRIDNEQIAASVLPILLGHNAGFEIMSSEVTDKHLYLQARLPRLEGEAKVGDPVQAGLTIRNSEVGLGSFTIDPMIYTLSCTNGMVSANTIADGRMRKTHLGGQVQAGDDNVVYANDTQAADDKAFMLKIRDAVSQLSDPANFQRIIDNLRTAAESVTVQNPIKAVEQLGKAFVMPQSELDGVLETFIKAGDYSKYGMINSVTAQANELESYDRAFELEIMGGQLLKMPVKQWEKIAIAA